MPGVVIKTATRTGPATQQSSAGADYFVVGITERGPVDVPTKIRSMSDYATWFGDRTSYGTIYDSLRTYFEEGGVQAWVDRRVGSGATKGTLTLVDRAGTPLSTVRIDAADPGAWSTRISVQVANSATANRFHFFVLLDSVVVETYLDLDSPTTIAAKLTASQYVRGVNLGSASAAPNNNPAVVGPTALSTGNDQRASLVATDMVNGLAFFGPELGDGAVAIPGYTSAQIGAGLMTHAASNYRLALLATASGQTSSQAKSAAAALVAPGLENTVVLWPWIVIPDGSVLRTISPEGFAAGVRARNILAAGSWRPPAGTQYAAAQFAVDLETPVDQITGDDLNQNKVSAVRRIGLNGPVTMYGWRSQSLDTDNYYLATTRDLLNRIEVAARNTLERFVFSTIDSRGQRISDLMAELTGLLEPLRIAGAFAEENDRGYAVDVGPAVNTVQSLRTNRLKALVLVRPIGAAETVELTVVRAISGSTLNT